MQMWLILKTVFDGHSPTTQTHKIRFCTKTFNPIHVILLKNEFQKRWSITWVKKPLCDTMRPLHRDKLEEGGEWWFWFFEEFSSKMLFCGWHLKKIPSSCLCLQFYTRYIIGRFCFSLESEILDLDTLNVKSKEVSCSYEKIRSKWVT